MVEGILSSKGAIIRFNTQTACGCWCWSYWTSCGCRLLCRYDLRMHILSEEPKHSAHIIDPKSSSATWRAYIYSCFVTHILQTLLWLDGGGDKKLSRDEIRRHTREELLGITMRDLATEATHTSHLVKHWVPRQIMCVRCDLKHSLWQTE